VLLFLYGFAATYAVLSLVVSVATVFAFVFIRENPGEQDESVQSSGIETIRSLLGRNSIRALVLFRFGFSFGKMTVIIFLPIYAQTAFGMNPLQIGGILAGGKLTKSFSQGYVGKFSDRVGRRE
jgi:nitrate/nitrite transporter NarK